ncbi:MAG: hypothetical protein IJ343_01220 [Clostridia bacterium]|nr:hypothetical protein [Clostridia bacterium]
MKNGRIVWELLGAGIGAGLASGREIASFFSVYGGWSWAGIAAAAAVMMLLLPAGEPVRWRGRWPGGMWRGLRALLLLTTGGAMAAGAGELTALLLPVRGAYWLGLAGMLAGAWLLAHRMRSGLAWISALMLAAMAVVLLAGMQSPPMRAVVLTRRHPAEAILKGMTYGGFNAALMHPILEGAVLDARSRRRPAIAACTAFGLLLAGGNAVLMQHPALIAEPMPFVKLTAAYGRMGYVLSALSLLLAILSTLTACIRALGQRMLPVGVMVLTAMLGFGGVVDAAYPAVGAVCVLMLGAMRTRSASNFRNCARKAFLSQRDMV